MNRRDSPYSSGAKIKLIASQFSFSRYRKEIHLCKGLIYPEVSGEQFI